MRRLLNTVMDYDWGSRTALAEILGRPAPSSGPEAELWIGAHASAPSLVEDEGRPVSLAEWIARAPGARLGPAAVKRFGAHLPFLLKILAAETPLSLQAHPSLAQARAGFAREQAAGIPMTVRERNYKDENHKPEILCALGRFDALCGFRPVAATLALLRRLAVPALSPVVDALTRRPDAGGLREAFSFLMTLPADRAEALVAEVSASCRRAVAGADADSALLEWVLVLAKLHPADAGVAASLLMNHVRLEAGEALFLPAGNLHSYLGGVGIELMASSDNVLRGGLTAKHVDVEELLSVLDFEDRPVRPVDVRRVGAHETEYLTPAADFRLSTIALEEGHPVLLQPRGPQLLLCMSGHARATTASGRSMELRRGDSVFLAADEAATQWSGEATLFRATVGDLEG